ncbi:MAG: hypothetical protein SVT52_01585 [Planctomycetota bacterium]|nr:hypothetical protein [Planctomycetota bacterium]
MPFATRDVAVVQQYIDRVYHKEQLTPARFLYSANDITIFRYDYRPFGNIILHSDLSAQVLSDIKLSSSKALELELFGVDYRGRSDISKVSYVDPAGKLQTLDYDPKGMTFRLGKGGFVTLWPDPFGLMAIYSLDQDVDVHVVGETPSVRLGFDLDGQTLMKGRELKCRALVCQEAGGMDVEYWQKLRALWGLDKSNPPGQPKVACGKYLGTEYITAFEAEQGGVKTVIPKPEVLPNNIFPLTVEAMNANWSAGAYSLGRYYPGAVYKGKLYLGLDGDWLDKQIFLGHPLVCNRPEVMIEIRKLDAESVDFQVYNPLPEKVSVIVKPSAALGVEPFARRISLEPSQTERVRCDVKPLSR